MSPATLCDALRSVLPLGVLLAYMVATQAERCVITAQWGGDAETYVVPLNAGVPINLYLDYLAGVQWALSQHSELAQSLAISVGHRSRNLDVLQVVLGDLCLDTYEAPAEPTAFFNTRFTDDFKLEYISGPELFLTELGTFSPPRLEVVQGVNNNGQAARRGSGGYFGPALDLSTL